jgi:hypothetical protein
LDLVEEVGGHFWRGMEGYRGEDIVLEMGFWLDYHHGG